MIDPAQRIRVEAIREHAWFRVDCPPELAPGVNEQPAPEPPGGVRPRRPAMRRPASRSLARVAWACGAAARCRAGSCGLPRRALLLAAWVPAEGVPCSEARERNPLRNPDILWLIRRIRRIRWRRLHLTAPLAPCGACAGLQSEAELQRLCEEAHHTGAASLPAAMARAQLADDPVEEDDPVYDDGHGEYGRGGA